MRFATFNEGWKTNSFGELVSFITTNSFSRENLNYENGILKNIHYGDIHTQFQTLFNITKEKVPFINNEINLSRISEDSFCKEGDIIFADASEDLNDVGKSIEIINLNDEKVLSGLHTLLARPTENKFEKGFLGYLLKSKNARFQIQKESQGSKVLSINAGRISKIHISYPVRDEQKKIADFFYLLDEKFLTQKKTIQNLESLMSGVRAKIFNDKDLFLCNKKLQEIGTFFSGGTPLTSNKNFYNGKIPFIKSGEINSESTEQFISLEGLKNSSAKLVEKGDVLIALYGATSGEVGVSKISGAINQAILCIRTEYNPVFIVNYLKFKKEQILKTFLQGGQGNLSADIVKSISIPILKGEKQKLIVQLFSNLEKKLEIESQILEKLNQQKKFFLQNLFV